MYRSYVDSERLPHARGDEPFAPDFEHVRFRLPHARGDEPQAVTHIAPMFDVCPTHVGMEFSNVA